MASDSESMAKQCRRVFGVLLLLFSLLVTLDGVGAVNRRRSGGCQEPPAPANGGVRVSGDGRIARYRCDDQHRLIGRDTAICLHTRWSHPAPTCQPVTADTGGGRKRSGEYSRVRQLSASQYTDQYGVAPNSNSLDQPTTQRARAFFTWTVETTNATPSTTPMTTTVRRSTSAEGQRRRPAPPIERRRSKPAKQLKPAAGLVRSLDAGARNGADPDADDEPEEDGEEDEDAEDGEEENDAEDGENETGKEDEEEEEERASPERPDADEDADDEDYDNEVIDDDDEESRRRQEASTTTTTAAPASWTTSPAETKMNEIESTEEVDEGKENGVETEDRRTNTAPVGGDDRRSNSVPVSDTEDGEFNQVEAESTPVSTTSTTPNTTPAFKLEEDDEERDFSVEDNRLPEKVEAVSDKPPVTDVSSADPDDPEDVDADDNELSSLPDASRSAHRQRNIPPEVDASILDTSCSRGETTTPPPPSIAHGVVSKYGRARSTVEPFNLFVEVLFQCETGYQLDTSRPDRLFCSNEHWIGPHPRCIQIDDSEDEVDNDTTPTTTGATTTASTSATVESTTVIDERLLCGEDRGGCDQICMRVLNESNAGQSTPAPGDVVCSCFRGFRLEPDGKTCTDIDECAADNGGCDGQCTNRPGGYFCSCSLGFRLASNGKKCIDNNECSLRNGHGPCQGTCRNTYGSYVCDCDGMTGTQLAADGHSCEDIDECVANGDNFGCSHSCLNTVGTAFCACPEGYMLGDDWKTCEDIDECDYDPDDGDQDHVCPGLCRNTIGSYTCIDVDEIDEGVICSDGFQPEFGKCQDINECQQNNGGCSHQCINSPGSWSCTCPPGLRLDPKDNRTCADVDECAVDNGGCSHRCVNVVSSFQCACPDGYSLTDDWKTCQDVDECELSAINVNGDSVCPTIGTCENLPGSYRCHCPQGFYLIDHQCQDIDECQSLNICGPGDCINQDGTYTCQCVQGYEFINGTCQDVDECERNPCVGGTCENSLGSFACSCPPGYYLADNSVCQDVDECLDSPCINGECSNEPGSFSCTCQSGYTLESNVCVDLDECLMSPCINGTCLNLIGAYRCECPDGFLADDDTCFDIDECQSSPCVNGQCVNTDGGYWCRCQVGYKALGNLCLDIDECETIPCVNGDCVNTQGSYECKCQPGYYLEDDTCLDVDECEWGPCVNGTCSNEPGSFTCTCAAGLQLNANSNTCTDVNECAVDNGGCDHQCTNTHGSFYCSCRDGYALDRRDGRRCVDVDECQQADNGGCSQICANQLGNYSCQCRPGFLLANNGRNCIEVVSAVTHYCPAIEPPAGGYLHCSSRPNQDSAYKPGTTCRLRCRKGYVFQRHKASGPSSWQNQVIDSPSSGGDNNLGLAILQGWKATQIWRGLDWNYPVATVPPAKPNVTVIDSFDAQIRRPTTVTTATESKKRLKDKADRRKENEKRHLEGSSSTTTPQAITGRPGGRLGNKYSSSNQRIKRQDRRARKPQDAGGNEQPEGPVRRCGDEGKWKGKLGFCRALTCPPLQAPANGSVTPLSCASGEAAPNQHCYFTCDPGFRVSGNPVRVCLPNLKWNPLRPPPSCEKDGSVSSSEPEDDSDYNETDEDEEELTTTAKPLSKPTKVPAFVVPPSPNYRNYIYFTYVYPWPRIDCPRDMMIDLPPGARTVNVFIPQPATNVDWNSYVEAEPSWAKKLRAELGPTRMVVSFRARNPVTEYTAICSFLLEVRDREPPAVRDCPHDVHVRLSSLEPYVSATWLEPTFTDNIAVTHIIKSKEPGSLFALGDNIVSYIASDASGNSARCEFTVSVAPALVSSELSQRESCPRLESPLNGDLNCLSWTWGQLCRPSCLPGHVFFRPLPSAVYLCGRDRRWKPGSTLPDCAPTSIVPEGGCQTGWEERRAGGKQCVGCAPGLYRPSNSTVCIPCPMGTYQDNFSAGSCKSCPKKLTTCAMGARQCTDCKAPDECGPGGGTAATGTPAPPAADSTTTRPRMRRLRPQHRRQRPNGFRRRGNATVIPVDF